MAKYNASVTVSFSVKAEDEAEAMKLATKVSTGLKAAARDHGAEVPTVEVGSVVEA